MKLLFRCVDIHKSAGWSCFFMKSLPSPDAGVHCPSTETKLYITNPDHLNAFEMGKDYHVVLYPEPGATNEAVPTADVLADPFPQVSDDARGELLKGPGSKPSPPKMPKPKASPKPYRY